MKGKTHPKKHTHTPKLEHNLCKQSQNDEYKLSRLFLLNKQKKPERVCANRLCKLLGWVVFRVGCLPLSSSPLSTGTVVDAFLVLTWGAMDCLDS